jgi:adenylate cyclase
MERRLAAILAADVVGYSRLMRTDEERTLARLKALRAELFDPQVAKHRGRIVKTTGDGALVEFSSAVDAVRCAVSVQEGLAAREAEAPGDAAMTLRIGINLGDIIIEDGDIYGDGVNLAARLEGLAEPGGICLSANVHSRSTTSWTWRLRTWATRQSRISPSQSGSTGSVRKCRGPLRVGGKYR